MTDNNADNTILELVDLVDKPKALPAGGNDVEPKKEELDAKVWAFQGAHGGAGVTSLSVQIAYELANSEDKNIKPNAKVLLIDLDFERGGCAAYLDIQPSMRIDELNATIGRLDDGLAETFIRKYDKNYSVIIAESELGGNDLINPAALLALLDTVATSFDYIILDIPLMWRTWTQAVIGAADRFNIVTELSVPNLHKTKELCQTIAAAMDLDQPPNPIANKFERRTIRHGVTLKDALHVLDRDALDTVVTDDDIVRQSINNGQPAGRLKSESRYAKSVRQLLSRWLLEDALAKNDETMPSFARARTA